MTFAAVIDLYTRSDTYSFRATANRYYLGSHTFENGEINFYILDVVTGEYVSDYSEMRQYMICDTETKLCTKAYIRIADVFHDFLMCDKLREFEFFEIVSEADTIEELKHTVPHLFI